jgi:predicted nucleic acid-binding Zn ribbon protein
MYNYDCPNCGEIIKLVSMNGMLEGVCENCGLEISIEKEDWIESLRSKKSIFFRG